jgi:hypothetical protein
MTTWRPPWAKGIVVTSPRLKSARAQACLATLTFFFLLVNACGIASENINFVAPFDWISVPKGQLVGNPDIVGVWMAPADNSSSFQQNISIVQAPSTGSIKLDVDQNLYKLKIQQSDMHVLVRRTNKKCGVGRSEAVVMSLQASGYDLIMEQVYTIARGRLFIGTYAREISETKYQGAINSVEEMCETSVD